MAKSRRQCLGCRDDWYNKNRVAGCRSFESARVVERTSVHTFLSPPYTWLPQKVLSCHRPDGLHWLEEGDLRFKHNQKKAGGE